MFTKYVGKPRYVEAVLLTDTNVEDVCDELEGNVSLNTATNDGQQSILLTNVRGVNVMASAGDWIVKGHKTGTYMVIKDSVFDRMYMDVPDTGDTATEETTDTDTVEE